MSAALSGRVFGARHRVPLRRDRIWQEAAVTEPTPTGLFRPLEQGEPGQFRAGRELNVLIPTYRRPVELAATLSGLAAQHVEGAAAGFGVVVSDQTAHAPVWHHPAVAGLVRVLRHRG